MGSGMCCMYAPESFEIDDETKSVYKEGGGTSLEQLRTAIEACPTGALELVEDDSPAS
jgi:ferredoxin